MSEPGSFFLLLIMMQMNRWWFRITNTETEQYFFCKSLCFFFFSLLLGKSSSCMLNCVYFSCLRGRTDWHSLATPGEYNDPALLCLLVYVFYWYVHFCSTRACIPSCPKEWGSSLRGKTPSRARDTCAAWGTCSTTTPQASRSWMSWWEPPNRLFSSWSCCRWAPALRGGGWRH